MSVQANLLPLLLIIPSIMFPQQSRALHRQTLAGGTLSGRIFAVTKVGDVKPAIMANVYLFFEVSVHPNGKVSDAGSDGSAGNVFLENTNKEMAAELQKMQQNALDEQVECLDELMVYQKAIVTTLGSMPNNKQWQIVTGKTDENGYFELSVPRQGSWMLVADGQAGANNAIWEEEGVRVFAGKMTQTKIGSPEKSCLNLDQE